MGDRSDITTEDSNGAPGVSYRVADRIPKKNRIVADPAGPFAFNRRAIELPRDYLRGTDTEPGRAGEGISDTGAQAVGHRVGVTGAEFCQPHGDPVLPERKVSVFGPCFVTSLVPPRSGIVPFKTFKVLLRARHCKEMR
ncbi:hypothetical protein Bbelb_174440 [Branchiostoma belcheri]|nr:hypothetical protein Bbelb_174440 [Branchiostoma belcheri]